MKKDKNKGQDLSDTNNNTSQGLDTREVGYREQTFLLDFDDGTREIVCMGYFDDDIIIEPTFSEVNLKPVDVETDVFVEDDF